MSKNWIVFFGFIDILKIEKLISIITKLINGRIVLNYLNVFGILFTSLIVLTGFFLIKNKRIGFILSYAEFPIRLLFSFLSFNFLLWINKIIVFDNMIIWTLFLTFLEIARLIITILIHKQQIKNARP